MHNSSFQSGTPFSRNGVPLFYSSSLPSCIAGWNNGNGFIYLNYRTNHFLSAGFFGNGHSYLQIYEDTLEIPAAA